MDVGGWMVGWYENEQKVGRRDVRAKALSWDIEWEKAKNVFFGFLPLAPTVARCARHSHPSPPEEKVASRKKSRFAKKKSLREKKFRLTQNKWRIVCIKGGMSLPVVTCHNRPSEAHRSGFAVSKLRSATPRLHVHNMPSPMAGFRVGHGWM